MDGVAGHRQRDLPAVVNGQLAHEGDVLVGVGGDEDAAGLAQLDRLGHELVQLGVLQRQQLVQVGPVEFGLQNVCIFQIHVPSCAKCRMQSTQLRSHKDEDLYVAARRLSRRLTGPGGPC